MVGLNNFVQRQLPVDAPLGAVVPFVCVEHQPGSLNNPVNVHGHPIIGKSAVVIGEDDELTIEPITVAALTSKSIVKRLRCELAALMNEERDRIDAGYLVSPETFLNMGIDATPQIKLHKDRTVLERAGVPTDAGVRNVVEGWRRLFQQGQDRHDAGASLIEERHRLLSADIVRVASTEERWRLKDEQAKLEEEERRAFLLRHEAEEIHVLCAMARSRAALTDQLAAGYAADANDRKRGAYIASLWTRRADQASTYLAELDIELADERAAIAEREGMAAACEVRAAARRQAIADVVATQRMRDINVDSTAAIAATRTTPPAHRAVEIIARAPLMLSVPAVRSPEGARYFVREIDDPDGLVRGVSLSSVQSRLAGVYRAQQKERRQIAAYVSRYGPEGLGEEMLAEADRWIRQTIGKWRHTPAMDRVIANWHFKRLALGPAHRQMVARWHADAEDERFEDALPLELPGSLRMLPELSARELEGAGIVLGGLTPAASTAGLPAFGVTIDEPSEAELKPVPAVTVPEPQASSAPQAETARPSELSRPASPPHRAQPPQRLAPRAPAPAVAAPGAAVPPLVANDLVRQQLEDGLRATAQVRRKQQQKMRDRAQRDLERALVQRAGDATHLTAHAARLLKAIADGFDPDEERPPPWPQQQTLAQRDAIEIKALSHQPLFDAREAEAKRADPGLMKLIERTVRTKPVDKTARIWVIEDQVISYDPDEHPAEGILKTPRELIEGSLAAIEALDLSLSRYDGLTGVHDQRTVEATKGNVIGLLYPDVQARLEARRRVQLEEELAFFADIRTGTLKVETEIKDDRMGPGLTVHVSLINGTPEHHRVLHRRGHGDVDFYLACRDAQDHPSAASGLRHPDATVRALLNADSNADRAVVSLLRDEALAIGGAVAACATSPDATLLGRLLQPPRAASTKSSARRGRHRFDPAQTPGRTIR